MIFNYIRSREHFINQINHIECNTGLYAYNYLGYPWYQVAIEAINNSLSNKKSFEINENTKKIRLNDYNKKIHLLTKDYDYIFITKSKQYRNCNVNNENLLFYDLFKYMASNSKKFIIFELPENADNFDLKYFNSEFYSQTIPYEFFKRDCFNMVGSKIKQITQKITKEFLITSNKINNNCKISKILVETYLNLVSGVVKNKLIVDRFIDKMNVKAVIGCMGTHYFPGLKNNYSTIEVGHGINYHDKNNISRRKYNANVWDYYEKNFNLHKFYALMLGNPFFNKKVIGPSFCYSKNIFNYGIPEMRNYLFSAKRIEYLRKKLNISKQYVLLVATSSGHDNHDILNLIERCNSFFPEICILVRQHPIYDKPLENCYKLRFKLVTEENLYDILSITDTVISPPSSLVHESSVFTDSIILYTRSLNHSNFDYYKYYPCKHVVDINNLDQTISALHSTIKTHIKKRNQYSDNSESEIEKLFEVIEKKAHDSKEQKSITNNSPHIIPEKLSTSNHKSKASSEDCFAAFLNPCLTPDFSDLYIVRKAIKDGIALSIPLFNGTLLDVGCGQMPYREYILNANPNIKKYIGLDFAQGKYAELKQPDITWDGKTIPLDDNNVDCAMAIEVLAHCPEPLVVLKEIKRVLKPDGVFFFTVPFLWPLHDTPHDYYRYTPFSLERLLAEAGFEDIQIKAMGGWNASLAQMIGLWLKRAPMPEKTRKQVTKDLFPFYKQLVETDTSPDNYSSGPMVTGLSGTARMKQPINSIVASTTNQNNYDHGTGTSNDAKYVIVTKNFPKLSETFILSQITGLIDLGHNIEIWAQNNPNENTVHPDIHKYNLIDKTKFLKIPDDTDISNEIWIDKFVKENKINYLEKIKLFHVHFGVTFNELKPLFMKVNQPVLVSFHGADASQYIKKYGMSYYRDLFRRADLFTTPSQVMKNVLVANQCPESKINIHRYGVNLDYFKPIDNTPSNTFTFLSVARLVEKKGLEYSLRAFAMLQDMQDVYYHIIGEGPLDKSLLKLTKELGIQDNVFFLGSKDKSEVIRRMQQADAYVLTSVTAENGDQEGLPVTLIEAHAAGLPVISTYHAGIPELVRHKQSGFLCEEKSVSCIAKYMSILAQHSEIRTEMGKQARMRADEEFNITRLNKDLSRIYHYLVHQNNIQGNTKFPEQDNSIFPEKKCDSDNKRHTILYILHDGGGGTIHTTNDLTKNINRHLNCYVLKMGLNYCKLFYVNSNENNLIKHYTFKNEWRVQIGLDNERKLAIYEIIDLIRPDIVHSRTFICSSTHLIKLLKDLNIKVVNSFHDFHLICPTIQLVDNTYRFCGGDCSRNEDNLSSVIDCSATKGWYKDTPKLKDDFKHIYAEEVKNDLMYCDAYIVTSNTTKEIILKNYPNLNSKKFYLIEHGRDFIHKDLSINSADSINNKILFFGALNYSKGCELVRKLINLDTKNLIQLHILGNINRDYHDHFQNMGAVLHGKYTRNNFFEIINKINPFLTILPSIWPETFCHTLTESWSCGVPVLGSSMGAIGERIEKYGGGWILDPYNPEDWYNKIVTILNDPEDYSKKKQDIQKMHFKSTKEMSDEYLDVYSDLLEVNLKNNVGAPQTIDHMINSHGNMSSLDELILLAQNAMSQKTWDRAISLWQKLFATYKDQIPPEAYVLCSMAYRFRGNHAQAEAIMIQGVKKFPEDIKIHAEYAQVAKARGNLELAEKHLKISEMLNQSQTDNDPIVIVDMGKIDNFTHSEPQGVAVIMPCIDTELGLKTADILQRRAGMPCKIIIANDTLRQGFIKTANEVFGRLDVKYVVYLAQDAFPGSDWLALAYDSLEKTEKGLLAFNDGKWLGKYATFGMVRSEWVKSLYSNNMFYHEYLTHSADIELSAIAKYTDNYIYNPNATLIEVDYKKDLSECGNPRDKAIYKKRRELGFNSSTH